MSTELIRIGKVRKNGPNEGRDFVDTRGYKPEVVNVLRDTKAKFKGTIWVYDAPIDDAVRERLNQAAQDFQARVLRERRVVDAETAATLQVGQDFDFGPPTGTAPIVAIGTTAYTARADERDPRVKADGLDGKQVVYVYAANPPRNALGAEKAPKEAKAGKPQLSDEEKAAKRAQVQAEMNAKRIPVREGDVAVGDKVRINGAETAVAYVGAAWTVAEGQADKLNETFKLKGKRALEDGDKVVYAWTEVPENARTRDAEAPAAEAPAEKAEAEAPAAAEAPVEAAPQDDQIPVDTIEAAAADELDESDLTSLQADMNEVAGQGADSDGMFPTD